MYIELVVTIAAVTALVGGTLMISGTELYGEQKTAFSKLSENQNTVMENIDSTWYAAFNKNTASPNSTASIVGSNASNCDFASTARNPYLILEPGYQLVLEGEEDDEQVKVVITVLNDTKSVGGIETRVVEERETSDGELVEVSRNWFAICGQNQDVYYFGEDVDNYEDGKVHDHEGSWVAGENTAIAGVIMPGTNKISEQYQQETAPGIAMDRAETVSMDETVETPAGKFVNVLKVKEENPLENGSVDYKFYAEGIGLIQDEDLKLVEYGASE